MTHSYNNSSDMVNLTCTAELCRTPRQASGLVYRDDDADAEGVP